MNKRTAIVTGANRGIGRVIAQELALRGFSVIMACRDVARSVEAAAEIKAATGNDNVEAFPLDLASIASVKAFAEVIRGKGLIIDALINNAGALCNGFQTTVDGYERTIQTNYLGQFLLTTSLVPFVRKGEGRIINTSSIIYRLGKVNGRLFDRNEAAYDRFKAYANSKLASLLFSLELAERLKPDGISVNSVDPGIVNTDILTMDSLIDPLTDLLFRPFVRTKEKGAETSVFLATDGGLEGSTGGYYIDKRKARISPRYLGHAFMKGLWELTERILSR